jgi:uncharacterized protein
MQRPVVRSMMLPSIALRAFDSLSFEVDELNPYVFILSANQLSRVKGDSCVFFRFSSFIIFSTSQSLVYGKIVHMWEKPVDRDDIIAFLRDFKSRNAEKYGILSLGIFGSVARGEIRDDSDVDIYIGTRTPDPFIIVHIKEDIENRLHRRVDIVRLRDRMNPFLRGRIEKEGIYV